jgi:hypothetical protein
MQPNTSSMIPFFIDLVTRTDEARRAFETNPKVLDIVANGLSVERYRKLLLSSTTSSGISIPSAQQRPVGFRTRTSTSGISSMTT